MKLKPRSRINCKNVKTVLRLADLEHAKAAVLNSLTCPYAQRGIGTPSTSSLTGTVRNGTINLRLGAVRRLAYEAADCGPLSADSAGCRVKGVRKLG